MRREAAHRALLARSTRAFHSVPCVVLLISAFTRLQNKNRTVQCEGDRSGICARSSGYTFLEELLAYLNRHIASDTDSWKTCYPRSVDVLELMITDTFISHTNKPPSSPPPPSTSAGFGFCRFVAHVRYLHRHRRRPAPKSPHGHVGWPACHLFGIFWGRCCFR